MIRICLVILALSPLPLPAADDSRVSFLEQEVRNLQRQVMTLSRRVDALDSRPSRPEPSAGTARSVAPAPPSTTWLDAAKWQKLRPGMAELDVVALLGPPTTMREEDGTRVLLYAMELSGGFLGGSVRLRDRVVTAIQTPVLQ
jgi:hypothetical protein